MSNFTWAQGDYKTAFKYHEAAIADAALRQAVNLAERLYSFHYCGGDSGTGSSQSALPNASALRL